MTVIDFCWLVDLGQSRGTRAPLYFLSVVTLCALLDPGRSPGRSLPPHQQGPLFTYFSGMIVTVPVRERLANLYAVLVNIAW